jgi:two-component system chemotaxis sensor kinase CheA
LDLAKYRNIFLQESADHLGELSGGLLTLEKTPSDVDALDLVFRMVHSIKGMAASLDFQGCADLAHRMEDRLGGYRERGCVDDADGLPLLFRGLSRLEAMVEEVRAGGMPSPDPELSEAFAAPPEELGEAALVRPTGDEAVSPGGETVAPNAGRGGRAAAPLQVQESPPKKV